MSEYDPSYLAEQNLYGPGREVYSSNSQQSGAAGGGGGGHYRYGSSAGTGGGGEGGYRNRGPRRSGGRGGWQGHHGGYGGGRGGYERPRDVYDEEEDYKRRVRNSLFRLGDVREGSNEEFHPPSELFRMKEFLDQSIIRGGQYYDTVVHSFKVMSTEQPHKTPLTAALLGFLFLQPVAANDQAEEDQRDKGADENASGWDAKPEERESIPASNGGAKVVRDLIAAFRNDLDARLWRNARLYLHLFASLIPLGIIQAASVRRLLASFAAVLEEPGVTAARGDRAAICIIETMCRAGRDLCKDGEDSDQRVALQELDDLVERVERYAKEYRNVEVDLVRPFAILSDSEKGEEEDWMHEETFDTAVIALEKLRARDYSKSAFLPSPLDLLPPPIVASVSIPHPETIILPDLLVPPDDEYADGPSTSTHNLSNSHGNGQDNRSLQRRIGKSSNSATDEQASHRAGAGVERVYRYPRWFKDSVPAPSTPEAVTLRSTIQDIIDLYQVNRKECAKILFDLPRWLRKGTFAGKGVSPMVGIFGEAEDSWQLSADDTLQGSWSLDELIVESILSNSLVLPLPPQKPLYYTTLLREIVTINPQSIAPAMGKSVRRVYGLLGTGRADTEAIRRFADWFSVHLSNFNFSWNWKEWIPDMDKAHSHPRLAFARRIVELEIRLAYFERIKQSLPAEVQTHLLPPAEPSPSFTYGAQDHPFHERATGLIQSMRARATAEVILAELQSFRKEITPELSSSFVPNSNETSTFKVKNESEAELAIRDVVMQSLLNIGSRSFSHFLNVVERYHALLRQLSTSPSMRLAILSSTVRFWNSSPQWILIIVDKWLQYRIIEPTDVIDFIFSPPTYQPEITTGTEDVAQIRDWSNFLWWELIKFTVHKVHGRVDQVKKRLEILKKEEIDRLEREEAVKEAGNGMEDIKNATEGEPKAALFPSGATVSTLPRRPDLPPASNAAAKDDILDASAAGPNAEKKQTVEEVESAFQNISQEQRKVLIRTLTGFVNRLQGAPISIWQRSGQESNDEKTWQEWWIKGWYVEYCRLFNKNLMANHETILANVFAQIKETDPLRNTFECSCQMASE